MAKTTQKTSSAKVDIRKAPRIIPFVLTFAFLGFVISTVTALVTQAAPSFVGYLIGWGTVAFTAVGVILAVVLEQISLARTKRLDATKIEG